MRTLDRDGLSYDCIEKVKFILEQFLDNKAKGQI